jgi:hypothetical protein
MGEIAEVDLTGLRAVADRVLAAAVGIDQIGYTGTSLDALPGSAVVAAVAEALGAEHLKDIVAALHRWAAAAYRSANEFEQAERRNAQGFTAQGFTQQ